MFFSFFFLHCLSYCSDTHPHYHKSCERTECLCCCSVALQSPVVIFSLHLFHATPTFSTSGWVIKSVPPQLAISSGSTLRYITAIIIHGRSRHLRHFPSKTGKTDQCAEFIIVFIVFLSQTFRTVICLHTAAMFSQWVLHPFNPLWLPLSVQDVKCGGFIILYVVCSF